MAVILGIDPGSRVTGFGLIISNGNKLEYLESGCIKTQGKLLSERLRIIFDELCVVIDCHQPEQVAIEEVFMGKNASSALKLGQARGAAMVACLSFGLDLSEYSARKVKQAVVGAGAADKTQVNHMVKALLKIKDNLPEDAADALAVAICHANTQASLVKMAGAKSFSKKRLRG